jgi:branched-chain amino acid transport system substrate-binding protein
LRNWDGINGTYDFRAIPQRGVGIDSVLMVRWVKAKGTWVPVSRPGGLPLK